MLIAVLAQVDTAVWGTVPSYFAGGALLLTFMVLLRDRREKSRGQADKIAAWVQRSVDDSPHRVVIKNASDLPCVDLAIRVAAGYRDSSVLLMSKTFGVDTTGKVKMRYWHAVGPGETVEVFTTTEPVAVRHVWFTDAGGRRWHRDGAMRARQVDTRLIRVWGKVRQLTRSARSRLSRGLTQRRSKSALGVD